MDLREIGWGVEWIRLAQDSDRWRAVVNAMMNVRVSLITAYSPHRCDNVLVYILNTSRNRKLSGQGILGFLRL
jgi:hypothetical protein